MRSLFLAACLGLANLSSSAQDEPAAGFSLAVQTDPAGGPFAACTVLANGERIVFDGLTVERRDADDVLIEVLGELPAQTFASWIVADVEEAVFYLGESSNGEVFRLVPGPVAQPEPIATLVNNYDAVVADAQTLYVSAATCGFGCGNEVWRVDLATFATTLVATIDGASGPVAFERASGALYYGTSPAAFPPPPTPSSVVRWSAAQLAAPGPLDLTDAELVGAGFTGASRLHFDQRTGALYLLENNFGTGVNRVTRVLGSAAQSPVVVEGRPFLSMSNLGLSGGPLRDGALEPFQPATGGTLSYTTTDFGALSERVTVRPLRPEVHFTGPGTVGPGTFELHLENGPPGGHARILVGPATHVRTHEAPLFQLSRPGLPLFLGLRASSVVELPGLHPLDVDGGLVRQYENPGGYEGAWAVQLILLDEARRVVATSAPALL